ncbi:MAG: RDD family protein [Paludibacteraceae bacterium]|nr:RDD family protein [Paludibacteraceae bacterium]
MLDTLKITNGQYVQLNYKLASIGKRFFAVIIDRAIQTALVLFSLYLIDNQYISWSTQKHILIFTYVFIYLINLMLEFLLHGKTIGKYALKIKVITDNCQPPSFQQCFIRWILYPIDIYIVGLIMITKHGQRLGDMASGSYIVCEGNAKDVKVSLSTDYQYVEINYKPIYKLEELSKLEEKDIQLILKALYDNNYSAQLDEIATMISKKKEIDMKHYNKRNFLIQIYNDYNYYQTIE